MTYVRRAKLIRNRGGIVLGTICLLSLLLIIAFFLTAGNKGEYKSEHGDITNAKQDYVNVIRASRKVQAGEQAEVSKFEIIGIPKELVPNGAVTSMQQLKGKRIVNELEEKEFILQKDLVESAALYEEEDRLIEHIFQDGAIPKTVAVGSVIDIKLFKPKAEDSVVVAKTVVIGKAESTLSFYLNKSEQENIKEAGSEGYLFIVQYLDSTQPTSNVSYIPSHNQGDNKKSTADATSIFVDSNMKGK